MTAPRSNVPSPTLSVDALFARLHVERSGAPVPRAAGSASGSLPNPQGSDFGPGAQVEPQPPPAIENPADLEVAHEWLKAEMARLEAYTRSQFAAVQQQHQSLLAKQFRSEEALALRAQELNREMKFLASQSEDLQRRAHALAEREIALSAHMERLVSAEQDLFNNLQGDPEAHRVVLERLRADTSQLLAAGVDARSEAAAFEAGLKERQQAWENKNAALIARQLEIEQRYTTLEESETASQQRLAELDDLEQMLRTEFEHQERRLASERDEIEVLRVRLRNQIRKLEDGVDELEEDAVPI